jgi:hypothetical protein
MAVAVAGTGSLRAGSGPDKKFLPALTPPSKGSLGKNLYTKSERLQSDLGWSERVNLCSRHIMILPRKSKTYAAQSAPGSPSGPPGPGNLYRPPSSPFDGTVRTRCASGSIVRLQTFTTQRNNTICRGFIEVQSKRFVFFFWQFLPSGSKLVLSSSAFPCKPNHAMHDNIPCPALYRHRIPQRLHDYSGYINPLKTKRICFT